MTVLYRNVRQARKVRISFWGAVLTSVIAFYGAAQLFFTLGLEPDGSGILHPMAERLAIAGLVSALGVAFAAGMYIYLSIYVSRIERHPGGVAFATLTPVGNEVRFYPLSGLWLRADDHKRLTAPPAASKIQISLGFRTATIPIRISGRRLPLILDLRVKAMDGAALAGLLAAREE